MGLFGNKQGKGNKDSNTSKEVALTEGKSNQVNSTLSGSTQAVPSTNIFQTFSSNVCGVCDSWNKQKQEWLDCPQVKELKQWRKEFNTNFCHPLGSLYRSLPDNITKFKYGTFGKYTFKERLLGLQGATLLVAIFTFGRKRAEIGAVNRLLLATRNSVVTYMLGGLLVAPEIYNPLLKNDL